MQEVSLTEEELQSLNDFHEYIFITGLMFDPQDITCNFFSSTWQVFVVPVDLVENRINFSYVQELKRRRGDDSFRRPSDPNDFFDFMVTFNYRASSYPVKVKNICHDKNSWSPFDDIQRANNYVEYYQEVYDIDIQRKNDPLLECEYAERLATLRPRVGDTPYVHLIPELVDRLPLEASVFEDLSCVPTVLQRLDQLLKAESFRRRFYRDFGIGNEVVPPSYFGKLKFPIIKTVPKKKPQDDDQTLTLSETIQEDVKKFVNEDRDSDWSLDSEDEEDTSCILDTTTGDEEEESIVDNMEMEEGANIPDSVHYENNNPNEEFLPDDKTRISKVDTDDKSKVSYMPKSGFEVDPMKAIAMYSLQRGTNDESEIYGDEFLRKFKSEIPTRKNQVKTLNITLPQQTDCDDLFQLCTDATEMLMKIKMVDYTFEAQGDQKELLKGSTTEEEAFAVVKSFIKDSTATLYSEYGLSPSLFIEVFTTSSARDSVNSERLETLGDAFLKWSVSEFLFDKTVEMPELTEGHLTSLKGQLVSNYNLCRLSREHLFNEELTVTEFAPRFNWMPPGFVLNQDPNIEQTPERQARQLKRTTQLVNDKAIADSMEALIGAIILSRGVKDAAKFVTKLGIDVGFDGKVSGKHWLPRPISFSFTTDQREQLMILYKKSNLSHCEKIINYVFKEKAFLVKAITHPSNFENRVTGGNQKLEFLGDAVLDYLITRFLFENKKKRKTNRNQHVVEYFNPGQLTDLRSALTNNAFLGTILIKYRLHVHLACLSPETWRRISLFAKDYLNASQARSIVTVGSYIVIPKAPVDSDDESQVESSINNSSFIEVPKILGDLFESILAAIYLDSERDMDVVWKVLYGLIKEEIAAYLVKTPKNPIRMIYENDREAMFSTPTEKKMKGNDEVVEKTINLCFKKQTFIGRGRNQKLAKIDAAIQGLRSFNLFKQ
jgi:dsRNA-specific ribonuclease